MIGDYHGDHVDLIDHFFNLYIFYLAAHVDHLLVRLGYFNDSYLSLKDI